MLDNHVNLNTNKNVKEMIKAKSSNVNILLLASIIASLNVMFANNYTISIIIILLELVVLTYFFIKKDITKYMGNYLIFLCLSFEFEALMGMEQFYGFKNFRIFGINLGILALLPVLLVATFKGIKIKKIKSEFPNLHKFIKLIFLMNFTGLIFGLFQILLNDNKIQNINGMIGSFIDVTYSMIVMPFLLIVIICYLISWESEKLEQLKEYLIAILVAVVVSMIVSLLSGKLGHYGGLNTLLIVSTMIYIPFMLLFPFYSKYEYTKLIPIVGCIGAMLSLVYNSSGKLILLYLLIPFGIIGTLWNRRKKISVLLYLLLIPLIILATIQGINTLLVSSMLFSEKLKQAISMISFWQPGWLMNMSLSPRIRIAEFINIFYEYCKKPWFLLFGKGYMGTIMDHSGILSAEFIGGAYSMEQWNNGIFYGIHETLNILFLYNGLVGVFFYLYMIKVIFKNYTNSIWILIGGFWFLMFYGFSLTITAFGMISLLLGYIEIDNKAI